ncbi:putative alcohol dehydrogenase [Actinoplanes missouriensis 431]|uniref:Putative alcohol dehydrogenase n=1 Tax=Actinoplanes missouriensis (strain ATCC 14538 / DSM 43046 / CBS 188.64 / JCM 3121 / NBRC 102363 / NCIMB 12654 / NRRL B-3342 / UNCC 431) TaxID=512565 RepID=I0H410_ACTM4|nr:zinc-binding alcohol dehydrogenase family protein [Actinoplanes missouriensis]BAL87747.1 putative alcohol dehydrogenase [Actinoplanes missouriensis 431]
MHAAVLSAFDAPPVYRDHPEPVAKGDNEMIVDVLAAGLHHLTRSKATGAHYSSTGALPLIPGADAVVRDQAGRLRYAALDDTTMGTFAERTVIDLRRSVPLPNDADPVRIAAAMNPGMSSWVALRRRVAFTAGQRVLIIGATGNAGRMAVQIAKLFGAAHVIAAGRDESRLAALTALGADETCTFDRIERAADVDVVIDYVWGEPAATAMIPMLTARADRAAPLTWIQIGSIGGATAPIPSVALRSARLQLVGSGIGSVPARDFIAELPALAAAVTEGAIDVRARAVPLADVERAWTTDADERLVLVP